MLHFYIATLRYENSRWLRAPATNCPISENQYTGAFPSFGDAPFLYPFSQKLLVLLSAQDPRKIGENLTGALLAHVQVSSLIFGNSISLWS